MQRHKTHLPRIISLLLVAIFLMAAGVAAQDPVPGVNVAYTDDSTVPLLIDGRSRSDTIQTDATTCKLYITQNFTQTAQAGYMLLRQEVDPSIAATARVLVVSGDAQQDFISKGGLVLADKVLLDTTQLLGQAVHRAGAVTNVRGLYYVIVCASSAMKAKQPAAAASFSVSLQFLCDESSYHAGGDISSATCLPCPANSARPSALIQSQPGIAGCLCADGWYKAPGASNCTTCPKGGVCQGGSFRAKDGFFAASFVVPFDPQCRAANGTCPGTTYDYLLACPVAEACTPNDITSKCAPGYTGYLCGTCEVGSYRIGERCFGCSPRIGTGILLAIVVLLLLLTPAAIFALGLVRKFVPSFSVLLQYIQVTILFAGFPLGWPSNLLQTLEVFSVFNANFTELFQAECIGAWTVYVKFFLQVYGPILFFAAYALLLIPAAAIAKARGNMAHFRHFVPYWVCGLLTALVYGYVMLSQWSLSLFACDNGNHVGLPGVPNVNIRQTDVVCDFSQPTYATLGAFSIVAIVLWLVGIPVLIGVFALVNYLTGVARRYTAARNSGTAIPMSAALRSPEPGVFFREPLAGVVADAFIGVYKPHLYWYELVITARKLLMVLFFTFLPVQPVIAVVLASLVTLSALAIHFFSRPFRSIAANVAEACHLAIQYALLVGGLTFYASDAARLVLSYQDTIELFVLVLFFFGIVVGLVAILIDVIVLIVRVRNAKLAAGSNTSKAIASATSGGKATDDAAQQQQVYDYNFENVEAPQDAAAQHSLPPVPVEQTADYGQYQQDYAAAQEYYPDQQGYAAPEGDQQAYGQDAYAQDGTYQYAEGDQQAYADGAQAEPAVDLNAENPYADQQW